MRRVQNREEEEEEGGKKEIYRKRDRAGEVQGQVVQRKRNVTWR